jgi:ribonuclease P protein component
MPGLVLQVWRPDDQDRMQQPTAAIRFGITASRKVGKAVARNRVRRRLREVARLVLPANAAPGHDYVLVGRAATLRRPFVMLVADLRSALHRLRAARPAAVANGPWIGPMPGNAGQ